MKKDKEPKAGSKKPEKKEDGKTASKSNSVISEPNSPQATVPKKGWRGLRTYKRVLIILFSIIFVLAGSGAGFFYFYIGSANRTLNSGTTTQIQEILAPVQTPQAPVTILLLGRDTRDAETERGRADTIMLLHINPAEGRASILSIPRDTLVDIPGYGEDKINAAYAYGGEELMIKTVSSFLGAVINHYITIDFEGFVKLIDELGGVDVQIDRPILDPKTGAYFAAGSHHFTGEQALAFTRSRSTEFGDIGRIQRQQFVLKELVKQKLNLKYISDINQYFQILVDNVRTDIDIMTIASYAKSALAFGADNISSAIIPSHPEWIENNTVSVLIPDTEEARAMWQRIIFNQPASRYGIEYISGTENVPESMGKNKLYQTLITVKNTGAEEWVRGGTEPFYLSYHWLDFETKKAVIFDGERTLLSQDRVSPGEEVQMNLQVLSPPEPGQYILQIDMVHEGKTWFSYQGVPPLEKYVSVNVDYAASYNDGGSTPNKVEPGQEFITYVTVTNNGFMTWENNIAQRVDLGAHWYNRDTREVIKFDADSGELPNNVAHNESATVKIILHAPEKPGRYVLAYDLVHEQVTWFSQAGVIPLEVDIDVGLTLDTTLVKKTSIVIYNGCGISGAATELKEYFAKYGFKIKDIANAKSYDFAKTLIIYNTDKKQNADQLAKVLNSYEMEPYSSKWSQYPANADLIVIAGSDYKQNISW